MTRRAVAPAVIETERGLEAACALWPVQAHDQIVTRLEAEASLSLISALTAADMRVVRVNADQLTGSFANINTPDDLATLATLG